MIALALAALLLSPASALRIYQSEHYDTEPQATNALINFKSALVGAGYRLNYEGSTEQVKPVGESFYFALSYDGFALPQPSIYTSAVYDSGRDAAAALRWFLSSTADSQMKVVESGVRSRQAQSYFWLRYFGDALPQPNRAAGSAQPSRDAAEGALQSCLGSAYRTRTTVLEKNISDSQAGPFYWIRYLGPDPSCR